MTTRRRVLDAALHLARTEGLASLTVRAVAAEAGIGATTLRHHFPAQHDLHAAVAERLVATSLDDLSIADPTRPPVARLHECLLQFLPPAGSGAVVLEGWFELHRLAVGAAGRPAVRSALVAGRSTAEEAVRRWLRHLAQESAPHGSVEDGVEGRDVEDDVALVVAVVDGLHLAMLLDPDPARGRAERALLHVCRCLVG